MGKDYFIKLPITWAMRKRDPRIEYFNKGFAKFLSYYIDSILDIYKTNFIQVYDIETSWID